MAFSTGIGTSCSRQDVSMRSARCVVQPAPGLCSARPCLVPRIFRVAARHRRSAALRRAHGRRSGGSEQCRDGCGILATRSVSGNLATAPISSIRQSGAAKGTPAQLAVGRHLHCTKNCRSRSYLRWRARSGPPIRISPDCHVHPSKSGALGQASTMSDIALPRSIEPALRKGPDLDKGFHPLTGIIYMRVVAAALLFVAYSIYSDFDATVPAFPPYMPHTRPSAPFLIALAFQFVPAF